MEALFAHYLALWAPFAYGFVFLAMWVEGDVLLLITAALTRLELFDPYLMSVTVLAGALVGDSIWFYLGTRVPRAKNRYARWLMRHVEAIPVDFHSNYFWKALLSKFTWGTHRAFLMSSGALGMRYRFFILHDLPAVLVWFTIVASVGYWFGSVLAEAQHYLRHIEVLLLLGVLAYLVRALLRRKARTQDGAHVPVLADLASSAPRDERER